MQAVEETSGLKVDTNNMLMNDFDNDVNVPESNYASMHWARRTKPGHWFEPEMSRNPRLG
jgi:hypothetical protein